MTTAPHQLGDAAQYAQYGVQTGGTIATAVGVALHAAWVPIVGPIVAGVAIALAVIFNRKGPKQKVATTHIVDDLEPLLKRNLEGYLSGPRTAASQAQALQNFDDAWNFLTSSQGCNNEALGNPGKVCISDRQAGSCKWHDAGGACWNWFSGYRDPIANDTPQPDPNAAAAASSTISAAGATMAAALESATGLAIDPVLIFAGGALLLGVLL